MKKTFLILLTVFALFLSALVPSAACLAEEGKVSVFETDREFIYYEEADGMRVTIEVFKRNGDVIFSVYPDAEPGCFFEFKLNGFAAGEPDCNAIKAYCFANEASWTKRCVADEVRVEDGGETLVWSAKYDGTYVFTIKGLQHKKKPAMRRMPMTVTAFRECCVD